MTESSDWRRWPCGPTGSARESGRAWCAPGSPPAGRRARRPLSSLATPPSIPRFGFVPASRFRLRCEYDVPDDVFMALELVPGPWTDPVGARRPALVRYHPAFADLLSRYFFAAIFSRIASS